MAGTGKSALILMAGVFGFGLAVAGCGGEGGGEGPIVPPPPAPAEYADKHMPAGWWTDQKIIDEGKEIYIGAKNPDVNCASCHGKDGKPVKAGARDFRNGDRMKMYSDSVWFWRISEGVQRRLYTGDEDPARVDVGVLDRQPDRHLGLLPDQALRIKRSSCSDTRKFCHRSL